MTAIEKFKEVAAFLAKTGIEDAAKEAKLIIAEILSIGKAELYTGSFNISERESEIIDSFAVRRSQGEPLQYIIGYVDFYGLKINVGKGILIPRPETELLVEETIKIVSSQKLPPHPPLTKGETQGVVNILDLCTGSGCIAIAVAKHFPRSIVYGVDMSDIAIEYAVKNAKENKVKNVHFMQGDLFEPVGNMKFDCIVSNPPYVKRAEIHHLQREIREYEPIEALDGGEDGLDFYRRILMEAPLFLKETRLLIMELGINQADGILELALKAGFKKVEFIKDYAGINRIFCGRTN